MRSSYRPGIIDFLQCSALIFSLLFLRIPAASAQQTQPQANTPSTTFVNVGEVLLDMTVRDGKGKLVPDLKPTDITLTDGGVPVKVSSLRLVNSESSDHTVTLLFDRLDFSAGHNAREIADKVLKLFPPGAFSISVMGVQGRLLLYQDYTRDHQQVSDAIIYATDDDVARTKPRVEQAENRLTSVAKKGIGNSTQVNPEERTRAQVIFAALQDSQRAMQELHTNPGIASLLALARSQRRLPGRKTIIYFSQGLQIDSTAPDRLGDIIGAANRSGVSIYAINANAQTMEADQGLMAMSAMGGARAAAAQSGGPAAYDPTSRQPVSQGSSGPGLTPMVGNQMERFESVDPNSNKSALAILADSTAGAYVPAGGDIKKPVRRMIEDMTTFYEASYASPVDNYNGQFRLVAVKALRPGVRISSRSGYFALPPESDQAIRPFEAPLLKILDATQLPSDVAFHARVLRLGELSTGNENTLVVEVPMSSLKTQNDPNTNLYSLHVLMVAQIKNKAGATVENFGEDIPRHGSLNSKDSAPAITMQRHFAAEPGQYVLEAGVFDQVSGKAGVQRLEFEVPDVTNGPFLSDLAMVQRIEPTPLEADPSEPMRYGNGKVIAAVQDQVAKGTKDLSLFFVVHPDPSATEAPKLEMEVLKSGESIARVPLTVNKTTGTVSIPYLTSIKSERLPAGDYKVIERLTQSGKTSERELAIQIKGPNEPVQLASTAKAGPSNDDAEPEAGIQIPVDTADHLIVTALPKDSVAAPTPDALHEMIESARGRALAYSKTLPNFLCVEVTNRSVDEAGNGKWKPRDSIAELLSYHDNSESRTTLEVNGKRSKLTRAEMNSDWPLSIGEFGSILNLVFNPTSKTEFDWKEAATLNDGSGTVQVLNYKVAHENATIVLNQGNDEAAVGFHGLVYLDPTTGGVRRVTLEGDNIPKNFKIRGAAMTVDYDFVSISGRDYLMPVRSSVTLVRPHRKIERNEISFRNYRRFASRTKIKMIH